MTAAQLFCTLAQTSLQAVFKHHRSALSLTSVYILTWLSKILLISRAGWLFQAGWFSFLSHRWVQAPGRHHQPLPDPRRGSDAGVPETRGWCCCLREEAWWVSKEGFNLSRPVFKMPCLYIQATCWGFPLVYLCVCFLPQKASALEEKFLAPIPDVLLRRASPFPSSHLALLAQENSRKVSKG